MYHLPLLQKVLQSADPLRPFTPSSPTSVNPQTPDGAPAVSLSFSAKDAKAKSKFQTPSKLSTLPVPSYLKPQQTLTPTVQFDGTKLVVDDHEETGDDSGVEDQTRSS